jgi:hypothetical protein
MSTAKLTWAFLLMCVVASQSRGDEIATTVSEDAQRLLDQYEKQTVEIERRAAEELSALRDKTIAQLKALQDRYARESKVDAAKALGERIEEFAAGFGDDKGAPPNPAAWRGRTGESYVVTLTGATTGSVWGTDVYTDDSDPATAAVHAGVLKDGQRGRVRITIAAPLESYPSSERNGVLSGEWGPWDGAFRITRAGPMAEVAKDDKDDKDAVPLAAGSTLEGSGLKAGDVRRFRVTGAAGIVWGTDLYTTDSAVAAAAVHAGVLKIGQTGVIKVTILPGQLSYAGTERNGITTNVWGGYHQSFKVEKP